MTGEMTLVLIILGIAIVLFASERLRVDLISMMVLLTLLLTGILSTEEAFSGFSSPAVITVWAIYIVSAGLMRTGVADFIGQRILQVAGTGEKRLIGVIMVTVGGMSAFMNNIGATAVLLPAVINIGRRARIPASKLLIPLAFGSLLGGITTLIGTPPNLLVSTALADAGFEPFSLFDYTPMGLIIMVSSIIYMVMIGRHLLPDRSTREEHSLVNNYQLRNYLTELKVLQGSPLIGKTIVQSRLGEEYDLTIVGIIRDGRARLGILPNAHIRAGDLLLVKGSVQELLPRCKELGVAIDPHLRLSETDLMSPETAVAEVVVSQKAEFVGQTLKEIDFRGRYGLTVLAIWRQEGPIVGLLADVPLRLGDILLVHGRRERLEALQDDGEFLLLAPVTLEKRRLSKAPFAVIIFLLMIGIVATGRLHISAAAVLAAMLMVLTGCLKMEEAYHAIQWQSVFLIAGMLPMGIAMDKTGTAQYLADQIVGTVGSMGPLGIMVGLFVLTTIITEFMSNAAAAVLVAPIAISAAVSVGADPRAFVMGVGIAASNSFLFPIGHQASVLVYGPGGYRFFDYTRVGLPLTLFIWLLMLIFLPIFWPF
ncbi:MAG: TRAP transporter large permease subunit [Chloroflexi bacterium]|nr:MAG: TRAP transporter large permease subunit [Chloroflexota bacterium]